jgi:hypothetical protein
VSVLVDAPHQIDPGGLHMPQLIRVTAEGVMRVKGEECGPVILIAARPQDNAVVAALVPLLSRRRDVYTSRDGGIAGLSHLASVLFEPEILCCAAADGDGVPAPLVVLTDRNDALTRGTRLTGQPAVVAASGHPVETAHLIDSYLRDPRRHSPNTFLERARP